jgi:hypothetical protein
MLSAARKEEPLDMSNIDQAASSLGGFGKMLNSLQGLQQRLEDFSITDVTNAEANAQTLILRLKQFQDTIVAIALLKNAAATISQSIIEIQPADTDVVGLDSLENHPQLHAIVKASKLIKLQKLMAALKASSDNGASQEKQTGKNLAAELPPAALTENLPSDSCDAIGPGSAEHELATLPESVDRAAPSSPRFESDLSNMATTVPSPVLESTEDSPLPASATNEKVSLHIDASTDFPTAEAEFETAIASEEKTLAPSAKGVLEDFPSPAEHFPGSQDTAELTRVKFETDLPKLVKPKKIAPIEHEKKSGARNKEPGRVDESKALVPANESFDLRLLDDLVSNYGEFASNPNLPATVKKKELQSLEPATNETHEVQPEQSNPVGATAPVVKKNGDLDRQLKKIIKDYGEYDLYSGKQTTNFKKAGILAFVFLGLVFGGIYFFTAPPSTARTTPAAANSSSAAPDSRKSRAAVEKTNGESQDTALGTIENQEKPTAKNK